MTSILYLAHQERPAASGGHPKLIVAIDDTSEALLMHCSGGMNGCTPDHFTKNVFPVIRAHGWGISIDGATYP